MPSLQPLDQIRAILTQAHLAAHERISRIRDVLGMPKGKRGRKPSGNTPSGYSSEYQHKRYEQTKKLGRCTRCKQANDRAPKVVCSTCAEKESPKRFHA
jgi:hypothetical protein